MKGKDKEIWHREKEKKKKEKSLWRETYQISTAVYWTDGNHSNADDSDIEEEQSLIEVLLLLD